MSMKHGEQPQSLERRILPPGNEALTAASDSVIADDIAIRVRELRKSYGAIKAVRGVMLKGTGPEVLYPNMLALLGFAVLLVWASAWRFRKQLG